MSGRDELNRVPAGFRGRAAARAIDAVVPCAVAAGAVALVMVAAVVILGLSDPPQIVPIGPTDVDRFDGVFGGPIAVLSVLLLVSAAVGYEPLRAMRGRQTLGKQRSCLAVVSHRGSGNEGLSPAACWVRWAVPHGAFVVAGVVGAVVGGLVSDGWWLIAGAGAAAAVWAAVYGSALLDPFGRGWHDKAAGTVVVAVPWGGGSSGPERGGGVVSSRRVRSGAGLVVAALSLGAGAAAAGGVLGLQQVFGGELDLYDEQTRAANEHLWWEGPDGDACWYDGGDHAYHCDLVSVGGVHFETGYLGAGDKPRLRVGSGYACLVDGSGTPWCWEWGADVAPRAARVPHGVELAFIRVPEGVHRAEDAPEFVCGQESDHRGVVCWTVGTEHLRYRQASHRFVDGSEWVMSRVRDDPPHFFAYKLDTLGNKEFDAFTGQQFGRLPGEPSVLVTETVP